MGCPYQVTVAGLGCRNWSTLSNKAEASALAISQRASTLFQKQGTIKVAAVTDQRLVHAPSDTPLSRFVIKTLEEDGAKLFINVCHARQVPAPGNWSQGKVCCCSVELEQSQSLHALRHQKTSEDSESALMMSKLQWLRVCIDSCFLANPASPPGATNAFSVLLCCKPVYKDRLGEQAYMWLIHALREKD